MSEGKGLVRFFIGGSFNPITIAHLRILELSRDYVHRNLGLQVESAVISPVGDHYSEKKLQPASLRVEMVRLAVQNSPWITVDDWEAKQERWVRTLDNLKRQQSIAQEATPEGQPTPRVMLVCGADLVKSFEKPGLWLPEHIISIIRDFGILAITRQGNGSFLDAVPANLREQVHIIEEWCPNEISSTKIRYGLKNGLSVQYLVPDLVLQFIRERHMYETEPEP